MKAPRGGLASIMDEGAKIAEGRLSLVSGYMDAYATSDKPSSGGKLTRNQFATLLVNDESFQEGLTEQAPFMTEPERARIKKMASELMPTELPPTVGDIPPRPF